MSTVTIVGLAAAFALFLGLDLAVRRWGKSNHGDQNVDRQGKHSAQGSGDQSED